MIKRIKNKKVKQSKKIKKNLFKSDKKKILTRVKKNRQIEKKVDTKPKQNPDFSTNAIFKPKIRVIGVGGGGGSIVSEIGRALKKASFVVADTDIRAMKKKAGIKYFYFGQAATHGLGTGMNSELAREAAEKERERITKLLEGQDIIILIASLGGGLGSGSAPVFAEISRKLNNVTLGIFTFPFRFEGKMKAKISHNSLQNLKKHLNALITIPNEKIFKIIDEKTSITEAFSLVNKNLIESLESLIDLIYNPGLINIDFADLRTILKGQGMSAFLNTVEASGKDRAEKIIDKIFSNPLLDNHIKAEKILFNIAGGSNLSMIEVEKISKNIAELNPKAKIIFGISKTPKTKSKIKTTLLITGPSYFPTAPELKGKIKKVLSTNKKEKTSLDDKKKKKSLKKEEKTKSIKMVSTLTPAKNSIPITNETISEKSVDKKKMIRRTALEVKKDQEIEENKKLNQELEWEIPAFLRRTKFKT